MAIPQYESAQVILGSLPNFPSVDSGVEWCEYAVGNAISWLKTALNEMIEWLTQPDVVFIVMVWCITFMVICAILFLVGFGPLGVAAYSAAAAFQSWAYGGFTPAGGVFATLTSMAMLGTLQPAVFLVAVLLATVVALIFAARGM